MISGGLLERNKDKTCELFVLQFHMMFEAGFGTGLFVSFIVVYFFSCCNGFFVEYAKRKCIFQPSVDLVIQLRYYFVHIGY